MKIRQIRNATMQITYGGVTFLVDPYLGKEGEYPGFVGTMNAATRNPLVPLPVPIEEVIKVDAVIVTHLHSDHFDQEARRQLKKDVKLFVQNEQEEQLVREMGFSNLEVLKTTGNQFHGVSLRKTEGIHGLGSALKMHTAKGETVCGVILQADHEKTVYIAGDTVWCKQVEEAIAAYQPEIIIVNAGDARLQDGTPIIMGAQDVAEVHKKAENARIIAVHMEAVNHAALSRKELKQYAMEQGMADSLLIPEDGKVFQL